MTFGTHVWPVNTPKSLLLFAHTQNGQGKMAAKRQVPTGYKISKFCRRQTTFGRHVEDIKATKKVFWGKTRTQKGSGKMAAEVQSWSQQFECLNMLGFQ